jgi:hypothetical protein
VVAQRRQLVVQIDETRVAKENLDKPTQMNSHPFNAQVLQASQVSAWESLLVMFKAKIILAMVCQYSQEVQTCMVSAFRFKQVTPCRTLPHNFHLAVGLIVAPGELNNLTTIPTLNLGSSTRLVQPIRHSLALTPRHNRILQGSNMVKTVGKSRVQSAELPR